MTEEEFDAAIEGFPADEPDPQPQQTNGHNGARFDVTSFLNSAGVRFRQVADSGGGLKLILDECVFDPSHKKPDAAVFIMPSGAIGYRCLHNSCSGRKWRDVRQKLDPGCYERKQNGQQQFNGQANAEVATAPLLINLATVEPKLVEWLWPQRVAIGKLTVIAGEPGLGKSQATLDMAARVTMGIAWPDDWFGEMAQQPASVVLLSAEDDIEDTIVPRLDAAGADRSKITAIQGMEYKAADGTLGRRRCFNLESDLPALEQAIDVQPDCRLVVIDPISSYLGATDSHKNAEIRGLLAPLAELAAKREVAVVCVSHLNKNSGSKAMHRVTGSLAFVAAARAAWLVTPDKDDPKRRLFLPIKNNLAADNGGLAFRIIHGPRLEWEKGAVNVSADEALAAETGKKEQARTQETAWLKDRLSQGPVESEVIKAESKAEGFSWRSVRRAADDLGVEPYKSGFRGKWRWRLQAEDGQQPPSQEEVDTFGNSSS